MNKKVALNLSDFITKNLSKSPIIIENDGCFSKFTQLLKFQLEKELDCQDSSNYEYQKNRLYKMERDLIQSITKFQKINNYHDHVLESINKICEKLKKPLNKNDVIKYSDLTDKLLDCLIGFKTQLLQPNINSRNNELIQKLQSIKKTLVNLLDTFNYIPDIGPLITGRASPIINPLRVMHTPNSSFSSSNSFTSISQNTSTESLNSKRATFSPIIFDSDHSQESYIDDDHELIELIKSSKSISDIRDRLNDFKKNKSAKSLIQYAIFDHLLEIENKFDNHVRSDQDQTNPIQDSWFFEKFQKDELAFQNDLIKLNRDYLHIYEPLNNRFKSFQIKTNLRFNCMLEKLNNGSSN